MSPQHRYQGARALGVFLLTGVAVLAILRPVPETGPPPGVPLDLATVPLAFEANVGQADPVAPYLAHLPGGLLFFTPNQIVLALPGPACAPGDAACRPAIDHTPECARRV